MTRKKILLLIGFLIFHQVIFAQTLRVSHNKEAKRIDRNTSDGVSTIVIDSKVKGLKVTNNVPSDELTMPNENMFIYRVNTKEDIANGHPYSSRILSLTSPRTPEYILEEGLDYIEPNTVLYYTVVLSDQFANNISAEYIFSKSSMHGVRISYGKRIGFYLSYKWGKYKKAGSNIELITTDYDVTNAKELGYIRTAITGGLRLGVFHKSSFSIFLLAGGGYGEYGRQWQNPLDVEGNIYFHSDYVKGFNGDLACQAILWDWLSLSAGVDAIFGGGHISVDYSLGVGFNLNTDKLFKRKINK